jgi:acetyl esterase
LPNELDPQVAALLEQFHANAPFHPTALAKLSVDEMITVTRQMVSAAAAHGLPLEPVARIENFHINGPAGSIPLRLYVPHLEQSPAGAAPIFVYYHGGGFVAGDLESHDTLLRALANRARSFVVSVAYRLAPENPYPAANDDAWSALTWVAGHGTELGGDPQRLAVGGDSAGGLLAAWVAQKAAKNGLRLRLQILLYPNLDATLSKPAWTALGTGAYFQSKALMAAWYDAYIPRGIDRSDPKVSPLFAPDLAGIAPALIVTADHDPMHEEGGDYAAKLKAANVPVDYTCWPGMIHGIASFAGVVDAGKLLIEQVGTSLRKAFQ